MEDVIIVDNDENDVVFLNSYFVNSKNDFIEDCILNDYMKNQDFVLEISKMMINPNLDNINPQLKRVLECYEDNLTIQTSLKSCSQCIDLITKKFKLSLYQTFQSIAVNLHDKFVFLSAILHECLICNAKINYYNKFNEHFLKNHNIDVQLHRISQIVLNKTFNTKDFQYRDFSDYANKKIKVKINHRNTHDLLDEPCKNVLYKYCLPTSRKCSSVLCGSCKYLIDNTITNNKEIMNCDCTTKNVVYLINCFGCSTKYVGQTERPVRARIHEHVKNINLKKTDPVSLHFNNGTCSKRTFGFFVLAGDIKNKVAREKMETFFIREIDTLQPKGLNIVTKWC